MLIATTGCVNFKTVDEIEVEGAEKITFLYEENDIIVYHDNIQNVTCWKYGIISGGAGISCIPDWMLLPQNVSNDCNCD